MGKAGRPQLAEKEKQNVYIGSFKVTSDLYARIKAAAEAEHRTVLGLIKHAVMAHLDKQSGASK